MDSKVLEQKKAELDRLQKEVEEANNRGDTWVATEKIQELEIKMRELNTLTRDYERELHR